MRKPTLVWHVVFDVLFTCAATPPLLSFCVFAKGYTFTNLGAYEMTVSSLAGFFGLLLWCICYWSKEEEASRRWLSILLVILVVLASLAVPQTTYARVQPSFFAPEAISIPSYVAGFSNSFILTN